MGIGFAGSLVIWIRGRGPAGGLAALFALGALRQAAMLLADSPWPLPADPLAIGEVALIGAGLAGLVALRSLWRTTRELDRAEDLHWDSMEAVRLVSELAAHPGASLESKLARVLEIGAARFALDHAIACRLGNAEPEILAWRAPEGGPSGAELATALAARLRLAAEAPRAYAAQGEAGSPGPLEDFLGAAARVDSEAPWVLAFAGARKSDDRFTATDKDLIGLMAQWLRSELLLRERPEPPARSAQPPPAVATALDRHDLNAALRRVESRLRSQIAADTPLELSLAPSLPALRPAQVALDTLALSLVVAAHAVSPSGALRVETGRLTAGAAAPGGDDYATLSVRVRDASIEPDALARAYGGSGAPEAAQRPENGACLPLAQLEALLRRSGADLSMHVEPGRGAVLTAFLPARRPPAPSATRERSAVTLASNP
jgi:hypothetical protein